MNRKISILFVIDGVSFGGGERVFAQIMNGLDPDKYNLFLASCPNTLFYEAVANTKVRLIPADLTKSANLSQIIKLAGIIKRNRIDIVHSQGVRADFFARMASWRAGNCRVISTIAAPVDKWDIHPLLKKIYFCLDHFSERFVDRVITVSQELENLLVTRHGFNRNKMIRIPNGIELDRYRPGEADSADRRALGISPGKPVIGSIGRLVREKGHLDLIDAHKKVQETFPGAQLVIAGEGPMKEKLLKRVNALKLARSVIFQGFVKDIRPLMASIDVFAFPSLSEGFPMITLEAMAMAKPIVASNLPGISEQIDHGKTGILVPPGDSHAIAGAVVELLVNRELAKKLGLHARKKAEKAFSVKRMITKTEEVYNAFWNKPIRGAI
ncbi:MAG: glycosyltransferase family 4 protein [Deltaproteobacteria bacterium]|nr:glycosyltransferase family 4 protein [Deltaproteobacteria bacterium]